MTESLVYRVRPSVVADDPGIRKVQVETWKSTYRGMMPDHVLDQLTVENPPKQSKAPDPVLIESRRAFVAETENGEIVGFAVGGLPRTKDGDYESELWAIYVLPALQGKGIGTKLFRALTAELACRYKNMVIWVLEENHSSHRFYERLGGKRLPLKKPFMWENEPVATEIAYAWDAIGSKLSTLKPQERDLWERLVGNLASHDHSNLRVSASMPGNKQIADGLVELYLAGKKTAGSGVVKDYEMAGDPLPKAGDYWIVLDSADQPKCIAKTIKVEIHPFEEVPEEVAKAEGEGDLSLNYCREAHRKFFTPLLPKLGINDLNKALVVTEFFEVLLPKAR